MSATDQDTGAAAQIGMLQRLGLGPVATQVYLAALQGPEVTCDALEGDTGLRAGEVREAIGQLTDLGLGQLDGSRFRVAPPHAAIDELISRREEELRATARLLEESRENVAGVLDHYMAQFRRPVEDGVEKLHGLEAVQALVRRLAETATCSVMTVMSRVPGAPGVRASLEADRMALRRGVSIRTVVPTAVTGSPDTWGLLRERAAHGATVRLHPSPPLQCLLVDGACAILPCDPEAVSAGAWVVRDPGLLQPVRLLLDGVWAAGVPVESADDLSEEGRVREVYRLLAQGHKDESVARRLDTSVRTVRRLIAEGMRLLGAESRFEAGVLAQRRGWLDD